MSTRMRTPSGGARDLVRWAMALGYTWSVTGSGHYKFKHPQVERAVFTPRTPRVKGNHKEKAKLRTALRRALEQAEGQ